METVQESDFGLLFGVFCFESDRSEKVDFSGTHPEAVQATPGCAFLCRLFREGGIVL
mgnify:FL=1